MASAQDTIVTEPRRGGRRATPPGHVKVFKTAVFKIHDPSRRKRAMLIDSMKRAHLSYESVKPITDQLRVIVQIAFISSYMDAILGWKILAHLFF